MALFGLVLCFYIYVLAAVAWSTVRWSAACSQYFYGVNKKRQTPRRSADKLPLKTIKISRILPKADSIYESSSCKHYSLFPFKPCASRISSEDRAWASTLSVAITSYRPKHPSIPRMVEEYAKLCFCKTHRKSLIDVQADFWQRQLRQWVDELQDMFLEAVRGMKHVNSQDIEISLHESSELAHLPASYRQQTPELPGCYPASQNSAQESNDNQHGRIDQCHRLLPLEAELYRQYFFQNSTDLKDDRQGQDQVTASCFEPYKTSSGPTALLSDLIRAPLTIRTSKPGFIYAYILHTGRAEDSSHVKIGYTIKTVTKRVEQWTHTCGYEAELVYPLSSPSKEGGTLQTKIDPVRVPNAGRVEQLIHRELERAGKRRYDYRCQKSSATCQVVHCEWHEIDEAEAIRIIEYWTSWMTTHQPYDDDGILRPEAVLSMFGPGMDRGPSSVAIEFHQDSEGQLWQGKKYGGDYQITSSKPSDKEPSKREEPCQSLRKRSASGATRARSNSGQKVLDTEHSSTAPTSSPSSSNTSPGTRLDDAVTAVSPSARSAKSLVVPKKRSKRATSAHLPSLDGTSPVSSDKRHHSYSGRPQSKLEHRRTSRSTDSPTLRAGDSVDEPLYID